MLEIHNPHDHAIELCMEPSGHALDMPPNATFEVVPRAGVSLRVHHDANSIVVEGELVRVTHAGEVLASWDDAMAAELRTPADLQAHLTARGQQIFATPAGATVMRDVGGQRWALGVMFTDDEQGLVLLTGGPPGKHTDAAAACSAVNAELLVPGFFVGPRGVQYSIVLIRDRNGAISAHALDRALDLWFSTVTQHAARFGDG